MERFLGANTLQLLKTVCDTYAASSTLECEMNIYDMANNQVSDELFKSFSLGAPKSELFGTWVKTIYRDQIGRQIVREQDIEHPDQEHVMNKIRVNVFAPPEHAKTRTITEYGSIFKIKFSDELAVSTVPFEECAVVEKEIKQRLSLIYANWRIDKTLRMKLDPELEEVNVSRFDRTNFDEIRLHTHKDIEIEYIGPRVKLFDELQQLVQGMYKGKLETSLESVPFAVSIPSAPQPVTLTQQIAERIKWSQFVWLYKYDGERNLLVIGGNKLYRYDNKRYTPLATLKGNYHVTAIDCEWLNGAYYIFDVMYADGANVTGKFFKDRMKSAADFLKTFKEDIKISIKQYYPCTNLSDILTTVQSTRLIDGKLVDGVILQKTTTPYSVPMIRDKLEDYAQFKVKARY